MGGSQNAKSPGQNRFQYQKKMVKWSNDLEDLGGALILGNLTLSMIYE